MLKQKHFIFTFIGIIGIIVFLLIVSIKILGAIAFGYSMGDILNENITFEEAQSLSPFNICLPTYLPATLEQNPQIDYLADNGIPGETMITLQYFDQSYVNTPVKIEERNAPGSNIDIASQSTIRIAARDLLAWQVGFSEAIKLLDDVDFQFNTIQMSGDNLGIIEITNPSDLQATMVYWHKSSVLYRVYSKLPILETTYIAESLYDCHQ